MHVTLYIHVHFKHFILFLYIVYLRTSTHTQTAQLISKSDLITANLIIATSSLAVETHIQIWKGVLHCTKYVSTGKSCLRGYLHTTDT